NNAIKFTDEGKIAIRADFIETESTFVFEVKDTGVGIPQDKQAEIFEPFIQHAGKKLFAEGTGLGLSITKKLIEMMDGTLTLNSQPDKGSLFRAEIPLQRIDEFDRKMNQVENSITAYEGDRKKVLIVDDNNTNVSFLISVLEPIDFIIAIAENGLIGLQKLPIFMPDLVLLDYRMPVMNGMEFIQIAKQNPEFKDIKIIGISATLHQKELKKQFHDLCDDFVPKPIDSDLLFNKMKEVLNMEWIYENLPVIDELALSKEVIFPANDLISALAACADIGDFNGINQLLENLTKENANYANFSNIIKKYSKNYDRDGIMKFLNTIQ
ncbi:MAG TPA: hypothetical protein DCQ31_00665, partial [Bacteroidales bacterium]|nr:hypothetical protein [Bacteroidales bacterium]